jgi:Leucine-rich repeat (LRR) protein
MHFKQTVILAALFAFFGTVSAQSAIQLDAQEVEAYSRQTEQIINYLEGTLNFLGDPAEVTSEKDIIINESYLKVFEDDQVQIEDDLDENREIPLSKNVQAYLKDVEFFYKEVSFTFVVNSVENFVNDKGQVYFKATVNRNLKGITINDDTIDNNQIRYFEINLNSIEKDLKIASIYTSIPNKKQEMAYWWNNMAGGWKDFFSQGVLVYDTLPFVDIISFTDSSIIAYKWSDNIIADTFLVSNGDTLLFDGTVDSLDLEGNYLVAFDTITEKQPDTVFVNTSVIYSQIKKFRETTKVDISNNILVGDLQALSALTELKELNISNTLIDDLNPLRNLNKLENLNCSGTPLSNLEALRYASSIKQINLSSTQITNIDVLANLTKLEEADLSNTAVGNFAPLASLQNLRTLKVSAMPLAAGSDIGSLEQLTSLLASNSKPVDLDAVAQLQNLQTLNIDSTTVSDLSALADLQQLRVLQANNSKISDLSPLLGLEELKLIYCDNSMVSKQEAHGFMSKKPECMVIFNTFELVEWWNNLSEEWHSIAYSRMELSNPITKEQLHQIINIKDVDLENNKKINDLSPLKMLYNLESLNVAGCSINDIDALEGLKNLKDLNIDNTSVKSLEPLSKLAKLNLLRCENTGVTDLLPLSGDTKLEIVYADNNAIEVENVMALKQQLPECLVVFQTQKLNMWWQNLSSDWQGFFVENFDIEMQPRREQLQTLVDSKSLEINNVLKFDNLEELSLFNLLAEIKISNTGINDISAITYLPSIKTMIIPNNPVTDISSVARMKKLEELNIENTSVEDLEAVGKLNNLQSLNIAGTKVKSLKRIRGLVNLEVLMINNTNIKSLKDIEGFTKLKELRCYNTKIKLSKVEEFKSAHPGCEVVYY